MVFTMIKQTVAATLGLLLTSIATPAIAAPGYADISQHLQLLEALEGELVGVDVVVNPEVCDADKFDGAYLVQEGQAYLIICQDQRVIGERHEVYPWTENDLDTIRHETFHLVQDCVDGNKDLELSLTYSNINIAIDALGDQALPIMYNYYQRGLRDSHNIYLELEAFHAAATNDAEGIGAAVATYCLGL